MKKYLILLLFLIPLSLSATPKPLPGGDVFQLRSRLIDPNSVLLSFTIKPGYFLYKERIRLKVSPGRELGPLKLPNAESKTDGLGNTYQVYRNQLEFSAWILNQEAGDATLTVYYQGCSDGGFCYPPSEQTITLTVDKDLGINAIKDSKPLMKKVEKAKKVISSQQDKIESLFSHHNLFWLILGFYGFGLLLAFTPCVLPMVPVLSGIIVGQGKTSTRQAFLLSLSYVLSMALTYALIGILFAAIGQNLQASLQTPLAIGLFSLVFVLLSLSMFGFYDLKIPASIQQRLNKLSNKSRKNSAYLGAAIMGVLATLILSPCVTAPLVGALSYIANTGDMVLGGVSLFTLGLGMGTPLLIIGTGAGALLPQAGTWMNTIKGLFGVMLLAVALYLASRILPSEVTMLGAAALLIIPSLYLGALTETPKSKMGIFFKGLGVMLLVYGVLILIGLSLGHQDPFKPLMFDRLTTTAVSSQSTSTKVTIDNLEDLQKTMTAAKGKVVFLDFYANWCSSCKLMEKTLFKDKEVLAKLSNVQWIIADVSSNSDANIKLEKQFDVVAPPSFIFFDKSGEEVSRLVGEVDKTTFLQALSQATP